MRKQVSNFHKETGIEKQIFHVLLHGISLIYNVSIYIKVIKSGLKIDQNNLFWYFVDCTFA